MIFPRYPTTSWLGSSWGLPGPYPAGISDRHGNTPVALFMDSHECCLLHHPEEEVKRKTGQRYDDTRTPCALLC